MEKKKKCQSENVPIYKKKKRKYEEEKKKKNKENSVEFQFAQRLNFKFGARYCFDMHIKLMIITTIFNYVKRIVFALLF